MQLQEANERWLAWGLVAALHLVLLWLLSQTPHWLPSTTPPERTRLLMFERTPPAPAREVQDDLPGEVQPSFTRPTVEVAAKAIREPAPANAETTDEQPDPAPDWRQQARQWAQEQAPAADFAPDPLRSRRPRLPGGERPDTFRLREPMSPAKVLAMVGQAFGDPGPPCPRIEARLSGLLTSSSDADRALLDEELRRHREYCRP